MTVFESFPSTLIVFTCFLNFLSLEYCIVYPLTPFWVVHFKLISLERLILADVILACFGKIKKSAEHELKYLISFPITLTEPTPEYTLSVRYKLLLRQGVALSRCTYKCFG